MTKHLSYWYLAFPLVTAVLVLAPISYMKQEASGIVTPNENSGGGDEGPGLKEHGR